MLADILKKLVIGFKVRWTPTGQSHRRPTLFAQPYQQGQTDNPRMLHDISTRLPVSPLNQQYIVTLNESTARTNNPLSTASARIIGAERTPLTDT